MQATEIYSDESCDLPVTLSATFTASCLESDCNPIIIGGATYYSETSCSSNIVSHAEDFFEDSQYIIVDSYSDISCTTCVETVVVAASGRCQLAGSSGQSVIATVSTNGSTQLTYYSDRLCTSPALATHVVTQEELVRRACLSGRTYLASFNGADTGDDSDSVSSTISRDGRFEINSAVLAGIIVGVLFLIVLVGFCVFRRCRRRRNSSSPAADNFRPTHVEGHVDYEAQVSPEKPYTQTTSTTISDFDRCHSIQLWKDDLIVAARIPREEIQVGQLINRGGYGEVYIGNFRGKDVAVKMLLPETKKTMSQVNAFLSEVKLMASLDHPCIVSFVGVAWDQLIDICVVSEYMAGGDLKALLTLYEQSGHPVGFNPTKVKIALHVAMALGYLHSCAPPVIHRDLKSKNILLDEVLNAKVTDFGISRERIDATMTGGIGTSFWMAPEVMMGERYDDKADMFSFGVVLSELDSHVTPYALSTNRNLTTSSSSAEPNQLPNAAIMQMVAAGKLRIHFSDVSPQSIVKLGYACVSVDPLMRPTAVEALKKLRQILAKDV